MFLSSPFHSARHPANRVSVCANELGGTWTGLLAINNGGLDIHLHLAITDVEALALACATTLRKMREHDETELADPTLTEEAA